MRQTGGGNPPKMQPLKRCRNAPTVVNRHNPLKKISSPPSGWEPLLQPRQLGGSPPPAPLFGGGSQRQWRGGPFSLHSKFKCRGGGGGLGIPSGGQLEEGQTISGHRAELHQAPSSTSASFGLSTPFNLTFLTTPELGGSCCLQVLIRVSARGVPALNSLFLAEQSLAFQQGWTGQPGGRESGRAQGKDQSLFLPGNPRRELQSSRGTPGSVRRAGGISLSRCAVVADNRTAASTSEEGGHSNRSRHCCLGADQPTHPLFILYL